MIIDKNIVLGAGFYDDEKTHIWGGKRVFLCVRNSKFQALRMNVTLGKADSKIIIYNCERNEEIAYELFEGENNSLDIVVNIFDDNMLLCVEVSDCLQPCFDMPDNQDYRMLGLCFKSLELEAGYLNDLIQKLKIDKNQTLFNISNFNKMVVHDVDYKFLENFQSIDIPGYFLDIGANIGQSATSIANAHKSVKILSYEPNKLLENNLEIVKNILNGRMTYVMSGVGEKEEKRKFYVPHIGKEYFSQEGSFYLEEVQSEETNNRIKENYDNDAEKIEIEEFFLIQYI